MADSDSFATFDFELTGVDFQSSPEQFATFDFELAPVAPVADSIGAGSTTFPTHPWIIQPGRWRDVEG